MQEALHKSRQMLRGFLSVSAGNYGALACSLLTSILLARRLGVEQFGHLALLLTASQLFLLFTANWTQAGFIRFASQEFASSKTVANMYWARTMIVAPILASIGVGLFAVGQALGGFLGIPAWGIMLVFGHLVSSYLLMSVGAVFQARQEMSRFGLLVFSEKAFTLVLLVLLPSIWVRKVLIVFGVYLVSCSVVWLAGLLAVRPKTLRPVNFNRDAYAALLRFSLPFTISSWAGLLAINGVDYFIIKWYFSTVEVGTYSLATQLSGVVQQISIIFSTLLLPQLSVFIVNGDDAKIRTYLERLLPYWFLITGTAFSVVLFVADPVVPLVFGQEFHGAVAPLAVLMIATSSLSLFGAFDPLMTAYGATWALVRVTVVSVLVKVVLTLLLIPKIGVMGAAVATTVGCFTSATLVMLLVQQRTGILVWAMGCFMAPVLVAGCLRILVDGVRFYGLAIPAVAISLYALVRVFKLFQGDDRQFFKQVCLTLAHPAERPMLDGTGKAG